MSKKKVVVGSMIAGMLFASAVSAGTTWESISGVVPGLNGSLYSSSQTKVETGALAGLKVSSTGGAELDARTNSSGGNGSWLRDVKGGDTYSLESPQAADMSVRMQLNTDFLQGEVPVNASWRSN